MDKILEEVSKKSIFPAVISSPLGKIIKTDDVRRFFKKVSKKAGLPPGTAVYIGEKRLEKPKFQIIDYKGSKFSEKETENIKDCLPFKGKSTVTWLNVIGIHQVDIVEKIGKSFGLHPLTVEDIVNTNQRPKIEDFEKYIFIVLKMVRYDEDEKEVRSEHVSMILGPDFVISFQEKEGDVFEPLRQRIRLGKGKVRKMGSDYLAYTLIDAIVDNYFIVLEKVGDEVEDIEEELVANPKPEILNNVHRLKRELIYLRKSVWPLREVIGKMQRGDSKLIKKSTTIYIRDLYDHTIQVIDTVETFRDMVSGMLDVYLSVVSNKMNEVMKVLTIFSTIFIPLTFIAGIYGMNFQYMPELSIPWAYPLLWFLMGTICLIMLLFFRRRRWL